MIELDIFSFLFHFNFFKLWILSSVTCTERYLFIYGQMAIIIIVKDKPCEDMEKDHFTVG